MTPCPVYRIFYTGSPGTGKSTIVNKIIDALRAKGCSVGGIQAPEVRSTGGTRIGFKIVDVATGRHGWLARKGFKGPRIGKYGVVVEDVVRIGVEGLRRAVEEADVIVIDEIGPMELAVEDLRDAIIVALKSNKPIVGVVHRKLKIRDPELYRLVVRGSDIVEVTFENRNLLLQGVDRIAEKLCCRSSDQGRKGTTLYS